MSKNNYLIDNYIQKKIYIVNHKENKFIFLKSNVETIDVISKLNRNLSKSKDIFSNITNEEKILLTKYYGTTIINKLDQINYIIDDWLNKDDTIFMILHKLSIYCIANKNKEFTINNYTKNKNNAITGDFLYCWYNKNKSLNLNYNMDIKNPLEDNKIDKKFVDNTGNKIYVINNDTYNSILNDYDIKNDELNIISLFDLLELDNITTNKKYNKDNWPKGNINLYFNGYINKYFPKIKNKEIILNYQKFKTEIEKEYLKLCKIIFNNQKYIQLIDTSYNNIKTDDNILIGKYNPDYINIKKVKLTASPSKELNVNINRLFADTDLDFKFPFVKLVRDDYTDTCYKLYEQSITSDIKYKEYQKKKTDEYIKNTIINRDLCSKFIKDEVNNTTNKFAFYIRLKNVFSIIIIVEDKFKQNGNDTNGLEKLYINLIIHQNGTVNMIVDNHYDLDIDLDVINKCIDECNNSIKDINDFKLYIENKNNLPLFDNILNLKDTKLEYLNLKLKYNNIDNYDSNYLQTYFENMYIYTRVIKEKQIEKSDDTILLRFKRVSNYHNLNTKQSIISTLKNPIYGLDEEDIIKSIKDIFDMDEEMAILELRKWSESVSIKLNDTQKNIYTQNASEPGALITISRYIKNIIVNIDDIKDMNEYINIIKFLTVSFQLDKLNKQSKSFKYNKFFRDTIKGFDIYEKLEEENKGVTLNKIEEKEKKEIDEEDENMYLMSGLNAPVNDEDDLNILDDDEDDEEDEEDEDDEDDEDDKDEEIIPSKKSKETSSESTEEFVYSDDSDDSLIGGGKDLFKLSRYNSNLLKEKDKGLFGFSTKVKDKQGVSLTYARQCQAGNDQRMPIPVTDEELEIINNSEHLGSGKRSYRNFIKTGSNPYKQLNYICPKYWDIKQNLSLVDPDPSNMKWDISKIIPDKDKNSVIDLNKKSVLVRSGKHFKNKKVNEMEVRYLPNGHHPLGYELPCCNIAKEIKEQATVSYILENQDRLKILIPNHYGQIPNKLKELFNQDNRFLSGDSRYIKNNSNLEKDSNPNKEGYTCGFLRIGRKQNPDILLNIFTTIYYSELLKEKNLLVNKQNFVDKLLETILDNNEKTNIIIDNNLISIFKESILGSVLFKNKNVDLFNLNITKFVRDIKEIVIMYQFKNYIIDNLKVKETKKVSNFNAGDKVYWFNKKEVKFTGIIKELKDKYAIVINSDEKEIKLPFNKINLDKNFEIDDKVIWFDNSNVIYGNILQLTPKSAIVKVDMKDINGNIKVDFDKITLVEEGLIISWIDKSGENIGKIVKINPKTINVEYPLETFKNKKQIPYVKINKIVNKSNIQKGGSNIVLDYNKLKKKYDFEKTENYKIITNEKGSPFKLLLSEKKIWDYNGDLSYRNLLVNDVVNVYQKIGKKENKTYKYHYTGIIKKSTKDYILVEDNKEKINKIDIPYRIPEFHNIVKVFKKNYYVSWNAKVKNNKIKKTGIITTITNKNITVRTVEDEVFSVEYKDVIYTNKYSELDVEKINKIDESRRKNKVDMLNYLTEITGKSWDEVNNSIKDNYNYNLDISNLLIQILTNLIDIQKIKQFTILIKDEIKKNLLILQKANNGNLFNNYKKIKVKKDANHLQEFKNFTKIYSVKKNFPNNIIAKINKLTIEDLVEIDNDIKYLYDLYNVYNNFNKYLDDENEYKLDDEILPIIKEIIEKKLSESKKDVNYNIIIFEDINDDIRIKIPSDKFNKTKNIDKYNWTHITYLFKQNNSYEPIYFRKQENNEISILNTKHAFINNTIEVIKQNIKETFPESKNKLDLFTIMKYLNHSKVKPNYRPKAFIISPYNKISHIITSKEYIIPIIPNGIVEYEDIDLKYNWNDITFPFYATAINYIKYLNIDIKGYIIEKDKIVNILLKNNVYIPINPVNYEPRKHKYSISGYNNLLNIDIELTSKEKDNRVIFTDKFNNKLDLLNIFNQSVAFYILTDLSVENYKKIEDILKDDIYIKYHKREYIFNILKPLIKQNIITILNEPTKSSNKKYKNCNSIKDPEKCIFPCSLNEYNKCKLFLKDEKVLNEFILKFIELLIINGLDNLKNIFGYKIENYELEKTKNPDEIFFTYMMLDDNLEKYLEFIFQKNKYFEKKVYNSKLFENKNIFDNNIIKYLENSPLIIRKIFGKNTKLLSYNLSETEVLKKNGINIDKTLIKDNYDLDDYKNLSNKLDKIFLLITKKYSKDVLNYNLFLLDEKIKDIQNKELYILFHKKEGNDYKLSVVNIDNNSKLNLNELKQNDVFINYITNNRYTNILKILE